MSAGASRPRVVLAPDLVIASLFDPGSRRVLDGWRDGKMVPVVSRDMMVRYLRAFRKAGVTPVLLKHWGAWFNDPSRTDCVLLNSTAGISGRILCERIAANCRALGVICFRLPSNISESDIRWIPAEDWSLKGA